MKKKSLFFLCLCLSTLFILSFVLIGCGNSKLAAPKDLNIVDGNFVWSAVQGADGYMVYFNESEGERFFVWENSLSLNDENIKSYLKSGQKNTLWIRAVKLDKYGKPADQSPLSRLDFPYSRKLDTPIGFDVDNETSTITFRRVDGATEYYAIVDGVEYKVEYTVTDMGTTGTIPTLPQGEYEISIIARGEGYSDSDPTVAIKFVQKSTNVGGDDNKPDNNNTWKVTFDLNYEGAEVIEKTVEDSRNVDRPDDPTRIGYEFKGWFFDSYCLIEAKFTSSRSTFSITANTTLYAKWVAEKITTTPVYFYTLDWASVYARIYNEERELSDAMILLNPVDGKLGWFRANIDDRTTRIEFSNGADEIINEDFYQATPYYKDGEWFAEMPEDVIDNPNEYTIFYYNAKKWTNVYAYAWAGSGTPNNSAWPGQKMTAVQGHDGWFQITVSNVLENIIFNGGNGQPQTGDLVIDPSNLYYNGYEWTNGFNLHEGAVSRILYYYNSNGWAGVRAYLWAGGGEMSWPGLTMTAVQGHQGWFSIEISFDLKNVVFNDLSNPERKTEDIALPSGTDDIYYKNGWVSGMN